MCLPDLPQYRKQNQRINNKNPPWVEKIIASLIEKLSVKFVAL